MCCTFGDKTDIEWYKKFKLPYKQSIGFDGRWVPETGFLAGLKVNEARTKVLEELKAQNLLLEQKPIMHSVNVHERCKKEIEIIALEQWFVNILDHKQKFIEMGDQIEWYPAFMKARYKDWVEHLSWDWCISRQRFFGIPFPAWHCKNCKQILLADIKDLPIDPQETTFKGICPHCQSTDIVPDTDVMDTWNTSSITPYICAALYFSKVNPSMRTSASSVLTPAFAMATADTQDERESMPHSDLKNNSHPALILSKVRVNCFSSASRTASKDQSDIAQFIPMSMRPQAHDIIRTWAFDTIVKTWMHHDIIPWQSIVISGHVLSDSKEKLSKSKDNSKLTPENLLNTYPADVIRYWTATGSLGYDSAFSENQLKIGGRLTTKLWNAFRFLSEHTAHLENPKKLPSDFGHINNWLLHTTSQCFEGYQKYFEQNEFGLALQKVETFFWADFCDNYLELVKNQLFNPQEYAAEQVHATRWTLYHVGLRILQMYAPYMPHITESLYESVYQAKEKSSSIHQTRFSGIQTSYTFAASAELMQRIITLIIAIRKLKTEKQLSLKTSLQTLIIYAPDQISLDQIKSQEQLVRGITQAVEINYETGKLEAAEIKDESGLWHAKVNY